MRSATNASEIDEPKEGTLSHGNRVMAGKEFKFLHKLEMKEQFKRLGMFKAHD